MPTERWTYDVCVYNIYIYILLQMRMCVCVCVYLYGNMCFERGEGGESEREVDKWWIDR